MTSVAAERPSPAVERILDIATVILLSLAAVATAWCSYQAAKWSSDRALHYSLAEGARIEASTAASLANAQRTIDVNLFVEYENAVYTHRDAFADLLKRRFPPEFAKAVDAWLATHPQTNARAPLSPFAMPQYRLGSDEDARIASKRGDELTRAAIAEDDQSDRYILVTVIFAIVSFLGGISGKTRYPMNVILAAGAAVLLVMQLAALVRYPVH